MPRNVVATFFEARLRGLLTAALCGATIDAEPVQGGTGMAQATLSSQPTASLKTVDSVHWTKIIGGAIGMITLVLQSHDDQYLIDRVTIVRGFAELSLMYPENVTYRHRVSASLLSLAETLSSRDESILATQVKLLHDRCRNFDESISKPDSVLTLRQYCGEAARRLANNA